MRVITTPAAGEVRVDDSLALTVLEISGADVTLGFSSLVAGTDLFLDVARASGIGRGYFRFSNDRGRVLVLTVTKGQFVPTNESDEIVIVNVCPIAVTLALCFGDDGEHAADPKSLPSV